MLEEKAVPKLLYKIGDILAYRGVREKVIGTKDANNTVIPDGFDYEIENPVDGSRIFIKQEWL